MAILSKKKIYNYIKIKLTRELSNGANVDTANINQIRLGSDLAIHYQNRSGSAPEYDPYFNQWVYNVNTGAYPQADGFVWFATGHLFEYDNGVRGAAIPLQIESVLSS